MLDAIIIALYFAVIVSIGLYAYKKRKSSDSNGFFVAGRNGGVLLIAGSLCATFIGSSVVIGMVGSGYSMGLPGVWWLLVGAIGLVILGLFLAKKVRRAGLYTLPELVEKQYGSKAGLLASLVIAVSWIAICAAQIIAAGKVLNVLVPSWDINALMAICATVFIIYTVLGGQYSIIRTDFFQFGILVVGMLVAMGMALSEAGGIGGLKAALPAGHFSFPVNDSFGWYDLVLYLVLTGSVYVVGPDMYSRLFCARDEKVARNAALSAAVVAVPIAFIIVLIGMAAAVSFPGIAPEQAFPTVIQNLLPAGLSGLVIAALLAAIMSSADTVILTTSAIVGVDIYGKAFPRADERRKLMISRIGVVVIGVFALLVAMHMKGIINTLLYSYTIFTSGIVIPVVAGFYKDKLKVNSIGAMTAIAGGGGTALVIKLLGERVQHLHLELLGFGVCAILLFSVSWLTGGKKK